MKEKVLMDTFELTDDYDGEDFEMEKENVLDIIKEAVSRYEKQYHTEVSGYFQIAHRDSPVYGAIGGAGLTGGRYVDKAEDLFSGVDCDDIRVYIDDNGLNIDYYDHDSVNGTVLKFITQSFLDKQDTAYDKQGYSYDETVDYLIDRVKSGKGTNKRVFLKAAGF